MTLTNISYEDQAAVMAGTMTLTAAQRRAAMKDPHVADAASTYRSHFENGGDDRPIAPWLTNETHVMTETEMREAVDALPDLMACGNVLFFASTADGTIPLR